MKLIPFIFHTTVAYFISFDEVSVHFKTNILPLIEFPLNYFFFKMSFNFKKQDGIFTTLNPMVFNSRFEHITEKILKKLDIKTLKNSRLVSKSWQEHIDNQKVLWTNVDGAKVFQLACARGHMKMAEVLIQNSVRFNIDLG